MITDPKALQYILQTSGYGFSKPSEANEMSQITVGNGILSADGAPLQRYQSVHGHSYWQRATISDTERFCSPDSADQNLERFGLYSQVLQLRCVRRVFVMVASFTTVEYAS